MNQLKAFILIYTITFLWWLGTLFYREILTKKDIIFLRKTYFCAPTKTSCDLYACNGWCISHFINYLLIGYFAPKYTYIAILIGAAFEFLELFLEKHLAFVDSKIVQDIFTNTTGAIIGYLLTPYPVVQ